MMVLVGSLDRGIIRLRLLKIDSKIRLVGLYISLGALRQPIDKLSDQRRASGLFLILPRLSNLFLRAYS
jgi:hypothetical protein